jgi:hypothetical protein
MKSHLTHNGGGGRCTKTINREKIKKKQKQNSITDYFDKDPQGINGKPSEESRISVESNNMSGAAFLE